MPYNYPEIRKFKGLFLQRNSFELPDGSFEIGSNITMSKDDLITARRGFYKYFTPGTGTLNALFTFSNKLLACFGTKISYFTDTGSSPNETGTETVLTGATVTVSTVGTSRSAQSNSNLYFTTDNGPLKLTAYNSTVQPMGMPKALDVQLRYVTGNSSSQLTVGNMVGYRVVFGMTDANSNLILGVPSDITTITNTKITGVSYTSAGGGPWTVTVTSTAHGRVTGDYITVSNGSDTDANGTYQITVTGANSFTYSVSSADPTNGTLDYGTSMPVRLETSIPVEITSGMNAFIQINRSSQQLVAVGIFDDFKLLAQSNLTSAQITAGRVFFTDNLTDVLLGANLYTNENSGEGEALANHKPPYCTDIAVYKGFCLFSDCITRQFLYINTVDPTAISNNDTFSVKVSATTRTYKFKTGVANQTVRGTCSSSAGLLITYTSHGFSNGWYIYVANQTGGSLADGYYYVVSSAANTFKISLTNGGAAVAYASETSVEFAAVTDGTNPVVAFDSSSTSPSVRIDTTARALVRAINRDTSSVVYANYVSGTADVPGQMLFQSQGFTDPIYVATSSSTTSLAFSPVPPTSFAAGTQVYSTNSTLPGAFFASKYKEPEAVPLIYKFPVGSDAKRILRIVALRDSVVIVKEDGVFRMTGDNPSNFAITILDETVICVAKNSVKVLNNQAAFLSNQGVCLVTESSVQIVSRELNDAIQPILGQSGLSAQTSAIAYETEFLYLLTTTEPNTTTASTVYAYNVLTGSWSNWDTLFTQGIIGPSDVCYYFGTANDIMRERKKQTKLDYVGQNYTTTLATLASNGLSGTLNISGRIPQEGDILVKSDVVNWITSASLISGTTYAITLAYKSNLAASDTPTLYAGYIKTIKFSPYHAGLVGREKFFAQMIIHLRDKSITKAYIYFANNNFSGSEITTWSPEGGASGGLGWGQFPWGYEEWGQESGININIGTGPAPTIRVLVPSFAARGAYIQPVIECRNATDVLNIQSVSFAVRAYGERQSR